MAATVTKTSLKKSAVELFQTLSPLFHLVQFVKCWQFILELKFRKRKPKSLFCIHVLHKAWNSAFSLRSRTVTKNAWCTCKVDVCFASLEPIPFLLFSLTAQSSLLKLPNVNLGVVSYLENSINPMILNYAPVTYPSGRNSPKNHLVTNKVNSPQRGRKD